MWPAGQRGWSIVSLHCGFDGVALVDEAKASDDNDRDNGRFQTCSQLVEHKAAQLVEHKAAQPRER